MDTMLSRRHAVLQNKIAGPNETIEDQQTEILVNPDDSEGLVKGLLRNIDSAELN